MHDARRPFDRIRPAPFVFGHFDLSRQTRPQIGDLLAQFVIFILKRTGAVGWRQV